MIYLAVFILLILLSLHYDIYGAKQGRDVWYSILLVAFILIAGLRWRLGVDTPNYLDEFYYKTPPLNHLSLEDDLTLTKPLWILLNSFVMSVFGRFYVVQLIHAAFINILFFRYIKRHSRYIFTCVSFYFLCMYTNQNMEEMKASFSVAICLYANDYILEKKWLKAYLLYLLAALFHASAYIICFTPLLLFLRLDKRGCMVLVAALFAGYWLQHNFGDYLSLFDMLDGSISKKLNGYANSDQYSTQGGNVNFFIVWIFPTLIYGIYCLYVVKKRSLNQGLLRLEPFVLIGLVFLVLQMSMQVFYRFVHFYSIYFVLFYTEALITSVKSSVAKKFALVKMTFIFLPFLLLTLYGYKGRYVRYYPYSSVIERKVDRDRELWFNRAERSGPNINQY